MASDLPEVKGLQVERTKEGSGEEKVKKGDKIEVHYRGVLESGKEFDASYNRGQPLAFTAGSGMVIQGWDKGLIGMKLGEKRKLTIAPELAYGDAGAGNVIPPKSTLIFDTEMVSINGKKAPKDEL